jgi:hypothetical protein
MLCLCLLVWQLAGDGFHPKRLSGTTDFSDDVPALDSFSEPSRALALLHQEVECLTVASTQFGNPALTSRSMPWHDGSAPGTHSVPGFASGTVIVSDGRAGSNVSPTQLMIQLHAGVQDLAIDLDYKLMVIYYYCGSWNEFLDSYLRLIHLAPERYANSCWGRSALRCAHQCGRAEEVADALGHLVQFRPSLPSARELGTLLDQWTAHPRGSGVSQE